MVCAHGARARPALAFEMSYGTAPEAVCWQMLFVGSTLGAEKPLYACMIPDRDRDEWVRLEIESNPLLICTRLQVLRTAKRT